MTHIDVTEKIAKYLVNKFLWGENERVFFIGKSRYKLSTMHTKSNGILMLSLGALYIFDTHPIKKPTLKYHIALLRCRKIELKNKNLLLTVPLMRFDEKFDCENCKDYSVTPLPIKGLTMSTLEDEDFMDSDDEEEINKNNKKGKKKKEKKKEKKEKQSKTSKNKEKNNTSKEDIDINKVEEEEEQKDPIKIIDFSLDEVEDEKAKDIDASEKSENLYVADDGQAHSKDESELNIETTEKPSDDSPPTEVKDETKKNKKSSSPESDTKSDKKEGKKKNKKSKETKDVEGENTLIPDGDIDQLKEEEEETKEKNEVQDEDQVQKKDETQEKDEKINNKNEDSTSNQHIDVINDDEFIDNDNNSDEENSDSSEDAKNNNKQTNNKLYKTKEIVIKIETSSNSQFLFKTICKIFQSILYDVTNSIRPKFKNNNQKIDFLIEKRSNNSLSNRAIIISHFCFSRGDSLECANYFEEKWNGQPLLVLGPSFHPGGYGSPFGCAVGLESSIKTIVFKRAHFDYLSSFLSSILISSQSINTIGFTEYPRDKPIQIQIKNVKKTTVNSWVLLNCCSSMIKSFAKATDNLPKPIQSLKIGCYSYNKKDADEVFNTIALKKNLKKMLQLSFSTINFREFPKLSFTNLCNSLKNLEELEISRVNIDGSIIFQAVCSDARHIRQLVMNGLKFEQPWLLKGELNLPDGLILLDLSESYFKETTLADLFQNITYKVSKLPFFFVLKSIQFTETVFPCFENSDFDLKLCQPNILELDMSGNTFPSNTFEIIFKFIATQTRIRNLIFTDIFVDRQRYFVHMLSSVRGCDFLTGIDFSGNFHPVIVQQFISSVSSMTRLKRLSLKNSGALNKGFELIENLLNMVKGLREIEIDGFHPEEKVNLDKRHPLILCWDKIRKSKSIFANDLPIKDLADLGFIIDKVYKNKNGEDEIGADDDNSEDSNSIFVKKETYKSNNFSYHFDDRLNEEDQLMFQQLIKPYRSIPSTMEERLGYLYLCIKRGDVEEIKRAISPEIFQILHKNLKPSEIKEIATTENQNKDKEAVDTDNNKVEFDPNLLKNAIHQQKDRSELVSTISALSKTIKMNTNTNELDMTNQKERNLDNVQQEESDDFNIVDLLDDKIDADFDDVSSGSNFSDFLNKTSKTPPVNQINQTSKNNSISISTRSLNKTSKDEPDDSKLEDEINSDIEKDASDGFIQITTKDIENKNDDEDDDDFADFLNITQTQTQNNLYITMKNLNNNNDSRENSDVLLKFLEEDDDDSNFDKQFKNGAAATISKTLNRKAFRFKGGSDIDDDDSSAKKMLKKMNKTSTSASKESSKSKKNKKDADKNKKDSDKSKKDADKGKKDTNKKENSRHRHHHHSRNRKDQNKNDADYDYDYDTNYTKNNKKSGKNKNKPDIDYDNDYDYDVNYTKNKNSKKANKSKKKSDIDYDYDYDPNIKNDNKSNKTDVDYDYDYDTNIKNNKKASKNINKHDVDYDYDYDANIKSNKIASKNINKHAVDYDNDYDANYTKNNKKSDKNKNKPDIDYEYEYDPNYTKNKNSKKASKNKNTISVENDYEYDDQQNYANKNKTKSKADDDYNYDATYAKNKITVDDNDNDYDIDQNIEPNKNKKDTKKNSNKSNDKTDRKSSKNIGKDEKKINKKTNKSNDKIDKKNKSRHKSTADSNNNEGYSDIDIQQQQENNHIEYNNEISNQEDSSFIIENQSKEKQNSKKGEKVKGEKVKFENLFFETKEEDQQEQENYPEYDPQLSEENNKNNKKKIEKASKKESLNNKDKKKAKKDNDSNKDEFDHVESNGNKLSDSELDDFGFEKIRDNNKEKSSKNKNKSKSSKKETGGNSKSKEIESSVAANYDDGFSDGEEEILIPSKPKKAKTPITVHDDWDGFSEGSSDHDFGNAKNINKTLPAANKLDIENDEIQNDFEDKDQKLNKTSSNTSDKKRKKSKSSKDKAKKKKWH